MEFATISQSTKYGQKVLNSCDFYGGFSPNKKGYPTILHFIFHLPGQIELTKLKFGDKSEPYINIFTIMAQKR